MAHILSLYVFPLHGLFQEENCFEIRDKPVFVNQYNIIFTDRISTNYYTITLQQNGTQSKETTHFPILGFDSYKLCEEAIQAIAVHVSDGKAKIGVLLWTATLFLLPVTLCYSHLTDTNIIPSDNIY